MKLKAIVFGSLFGLALWALIVIGFKRMGL